MENISVELVASVLGTDPGVLVESLKTTDGNPEAILKDLFQKKLGEIRKLGHDEGHGRGKREGLTVIEKELAKKHEISEYQGIEGLIDGIIEKNAHKSKLNPDDVRKSEVYMNEMKAKNDEIMKAKNEFKQFKSDIEHEQVRSVVNNAAISILENPEHKYLLPTDQTIKGNILKTFQNSIWSENVKYDIREGKIIGVLDKEGQVVRDENYNPLTFEQYVHKNAKGYFEVSKADDRQGTGAGTQPPAGGGNGSLNFKDREDYFNAYVKEKDPKTLDAMKKYEEEKIATGVWK